MNRSILPMISMLAVLPAGCVSSQLPPPLTMAQGERLAEIPLPYSVGVVPHKHPAYSDKLTLALRSAGIFARVSPISDFTGSPDLVASVEETVHGTAVIPAATFATAGVVPTIAEEDHGFVFALAPAAQRSRKTRIDASYRGATTLGWGALAVNASPDFTGSDPEQSDRFLRMLAYRTLEALRPGRTGH